MLVHTAAYMCICTQAGEAEIAQRKDSVIILLYT